MKGWSRSSCGDDKTRIRIWSRLLFFGSDPSRILGTLRSPLQMNLCCEPPFWPNTPARNKRLLPSGESGVTLPLRYLRKWHIGKRNTACCYGFSVGKTPITATRTCKRLPIPCVLILEVCRMALASRAGWLNTTSEKRSQCTN